MYYIVCKYRNKQMKLNKLTASCVTALMTVGLSATATAALTVYQPSNTQTVVSGQLKGIEGSVSEQINTVEKNYSGYIDDSTQKIINAIKVATSQEAFSSVQMSEADKNSKQVLVNAMVADAQSEAALKAMVKFSPTMGQGYSACAVLAQNGQLAQVMDTVKGQATTKVTETDNSPLSVVSSSSTAFKGRTTAHNKDFCTDAEGQRDICDPVAPEMQGADSNAATLFVSAPRDSDASKAKRAVRQNILGSPTIAIPSSVAGTSGGQAYLYATNHKTALSAFPAYSLAYLESMSEIREDVKDADGNPMSPNDMLFNTVARYYGGADSVEWQKSMIAQQPRGLLVELAKMEGLGAWMDYQEYLANQRMEGNLAALTLTSAIPMEQRLEKQRQRSVSQAIRDNIVK